VHPQGCEREVAEAQKGSSNELLNECIMRLSWALVHSRRPEDVQRGTAMLEGGNIYKTRLLCVCVCVSPPLGPLNQEVCPAEMAVNI
jgi:hypothetical protein